MSFSTLTSPFSFPLPKSHHFSHSLLSLNLSSLSSLSLTLSHSLSHLSHSLSHLSITIFSNSLTLTSPSHSHSLSILPKGIFSPNFKFFSLICVFGVSFEFVWGLGLSKGEGLEFGLDLWYNNFRGDYAVFFFLCGYLTIFIFFL